MAAILKTLEYQTQLQKVQNDLKCENIVQHHARESIFMVMTSSMTPQRGLQLDPKCSFMDETRTFFIIPKTYTDIHLLYIWIILFWLHFYKFVFMASLMTPSGPKINRKMNCHISINVSVIVSIKYSKCRKWSWLSCRHIQRPVSLPLKACRELNMSKVIYV